MACGVHYFPKFSCCCACADVFLRQPGPLPGTSLSGVSHTLDALFQKSQIDLPTPFAYAPSPATFCPARGPFHSTPADSFDPDAWEAAARAAAEAAAAEDDASDAVNITPGLAAAAVATNTTDFCPDAWEVAAAAAAAAATAEDGQSQSHPSRPADRSASRLAPLPEPCWAVRTLSEALQAATESGLQYAQSAQPTGHSAQTPAAGSNDSSGSNAPCVQELLLLPAPEAAQQLRQLPAAQRAGLLLLLCGADGVQATGASIACFGSRGEAWLLMVLDGVAADLGLLEIGVLLAAICHRWVRTGWAGCTRKRHVCIGGNSDMLVALLCNLQGCMAHQTGGLLFSATPSCIEVMHRLGEGDT